MQSRWADGDDDGQIVRRQKLKKPKRKHDQQQQQHEEPLPTSPTTQSPPSLPDKQPPAPSPPPKPLPIPLTPTKQSGRTGPPIHACRSVENFEKLNRISEGTYGIVYRARDLLTSSIVALKRIKVDPKDTQSDGFTITFLREIHTLMMVSNHPHVLNVKEIVTGGEGGGGVGGGGVFMVMEFVEHDLKTLMESMKTPFLVSETKTIMRQLCGAIGYLHDNWIVHRDLKTSNLLFTNNGMLKVADFGLARTFGSPPGNMTQLVVTLWYRAPEILFGATEYTTAVDMWSVGCIFAELIKHEPLFPGKSEFEQLNKIFTLLGTPSEEIWPGMSKLPAAKNFQFAPIPPGQLKLKFQGHLTENGLHLLSSLLLYDPEYRMEAKEALEHAYFTEHPPPKDPSLFPTWPSHAEGQKRRRVESPTAPHSHGLFQD